MVTTGFFLRDLLIDSFQFPEYGMRSDPTVDPTTVVPDLEAILLDGFHEVQVLVTLHPTEYDVAYRELGRVRR